MRIFATALAAVLPLSLAFVAPTVAGAEGSGLTITASTTVTADPVCGAGPCVEITGSGLEVNGASHVVDCGGVPGTIGIVIKGTSNHVHSFEVRNCEIGVMVDGGGWHHLNELYVHDSVYRQDGTLHPGSGNGIFLYFTTGNLVNGNRSISNDAFGVHLENSTFNTFHTMWVTDNCPSTASPPPHSGGYLLNQSDDNWITSNDISRNGDVGVEIRNSDGNTLQSSIVNDTKCTGTPGTGIVIIVSADYNVLRGNQAMRNENGISIGCPLGCTNTSGPSVSSKDNLLQDNNASSNAEEGIQIGVSNRRNRLQSNTSLANLLLDMRDDNPNCDQNVWRSNTFMTDSEGNGPTKGCIR